MIYYYVASPKVKNRKAIGKVMSRNKCLFMAKRHRTLIEKDSSIKMMIIKSEKEKNKNSNIFAEDVIEYI